MMKQTDFQQKEEEHSTMHIELQATDSSGSSSSKDFDDDIEIQDEMQMPQSEPIHEPPAKMHQPIHPRPLLSIRKGIALLLGVTPVCLFALEMFPERCHICLDNVELDTYFFAAAICGGLGAALYGDTADYLLARLFGGAMSALGSLFTIWLLLSTIHSNLAFLFIFIGILGAMPGLVAYFIIRILSDECYFSDVDDYDEIAPLTKLIIVSAD